jgi:hypothetical protein
VGGQGQRPRRRPGRDAGEQLGWGGHPLWRGHLPAGRAGLAERGQGELVKAEPVAPAERQRRTHGHDRKGQRVGDHRRDEELGGRGQ